MTINNINIDETLQRAKRHLAEEKEMSFATKSLMELLLLVISLLVERLSLDSRNSSKPPSQDPNRKKKSKEKKANSKGGQKGHAGKTLEKVSNPDETIEHLVRECGGCHDNLQLQQAKSHVLRQVFEVVIKRHVVEHKAEVKECSKCGTITTGKFPEGVTKAVQYGISAKKLSVYMSQSQLIPYKRVEEFFNAQLGMSLSSGTIYKFNREAFERLLEFEVDVKKGLLESPLNHTDETGLNIGGKRSWLHSISNETWTYFYPHNSRGKDAIEEMGVLPLYSGTLCHDYYVAYYEYGSLHVLCNSHHLRELERSAEQDNQN